MNEQNATLLRMQRSIDRMEGMLKIIDNRVMHLHTKMLANTKNNHTQPRKGGSYFANENKKAAVVTPAMIQSLLWRPPNYYKKPSATRKLTIH